jgi:protoheme IX farnesyltransferase
VSAAALPLPADPARPGAALQLTAVAALAAVAATAVSGDLGAPHRLLAAVALPPLVALVLAGGLARRPVAVPSTLALALFLAAAVAPGSAAHTGLGVADVGATLAVVAATRRGEGAARGRAADYLALTKPRVMSLLLVTGACGALVGARGWPGTGSFAATVAGLALACGGAAALNHVLDRDIDRLMGKRTRDRPVAAGRLAPARAFEFGLGLSAASFALLAVATNVLAAVLALAGNAFYVVVYTGWLKRRGPANIVLGGAAGAVPPLVGYAAATGRLGAPALWLFLVVFLWTPPHFWALALLLRDHYAAARVPMAPVVLGERGTLRRIVWYTAALVAGSLLPVATGTFGAVYLAAAVVLGGWFGALVLQLVRAPERRRAAVVFHASLLYLALLFAAAALDAAL